MLYICVRMCMCANIIDSWQHTVSYKELNHRLFYGGNGTIAAQGVGPLGKCSTQFLMPCNHSTGKKAGVSQEVVGKEDGAPGRAAPCVRVLQGAPALAAPWHFQWMKPYSCYKHLDLDYYSW